MKKREKIDLLETQIESMQASITLLEARIAILEAGFPHTPAPTTPWPSPWDPHVPWQPNQPFGPIKYENKCHVCGIDQTGGMGYVCSRPDCPNGTVTCSTENPNEGAGT